MKHTKAFLQMHIPDLELPKYLDCFVAVVKL